MKKKKIVILVVISVLVLCVIGFGVNKIFFQDNSEIAESKEEKKSKDNDTKKKIQEKEESSEEQEAKEESTDELSVENEEENTVSSNNSESDISSNSSSSSYNSQSQITNNSSSVSTSQQAPSTPQTPPTESQTPPQEQQPLTAWEQLGISKEEYYNTPLIAGDEVAFSGDISVCEAEVDSLIAKYYKQGLSRGNSYDVIGKYTHSHIGCGLNVYINGVKYSYSQTKAMGFN